MDDKIRTSKQNYACIECKNENELSNEHEVGDILECPHCGIEYEITAVDEEKEYELILLEEEK